MKRESAPKQEIKEERPQHEIELEQRPTPQEGESLDIWLNRIGGPCVEMKGNLKIDSIHRLSEKEKENAPFIISRNGDFILNDKNLGKHFNVESVNKLLEEKNLNIRKKETEKRGIEYRFKKDLFETPADYFDVIVKGLNKKQHVVADKAFAKSVGKWAEEFEKEEAPSAFEEDLSAEDLEEEDPVEAEVPTEVGEKEVKEEPEKPSSAKATEDKEKLSEAKSTEASSEGGPLTLDEKIEQKEEELEKTEQNYNIYYSPVVQSLFGLYYKAEFKSLKKEVKKLKKTRKKVGGDMIVEEAVEAPTPAEGEAEVPTEVGKEKPTRKEYLKHIKYADKLFIEMAKVKGAVNEKEADPSEYEELKSEWKAAYKKIGEMYDSLSEKDQKKIMKKEEKETRRNKKGKSLLKKKWKEFWKLLAKKVGKETIEEVTIDAIEEQLKEIKKKLRKVSKDIKEGGVLGRAAKEKEETNLEKELVRLEKMRKKIKERLKIQKRLGEIPKEIRKSGVLEQTKLEDEERKLEKRLKKLK